VPSAGGRVRVNYRLRSPRLPPGRPIPAFSPDEINSRFQRGDVSLRNFGHWSTEIYGFGLLYRKLLKWGRIHPLPFTSEHGIPFGTSSLAYAEQERQSSGCEPLHLTWNLDVCRAACQEGIESIRIPHPWSLGWRMGEKKREQVWEGPLLLVPHSLPEVSAVDDKTFWADYFTNLSQDQHPSAALISHHDLGGSAQSELLRRGVPIFSLGSATSDLFFDLFYEIIGQFSHVMGPNLSSASFYSTDFGVPFELVGHELKFDYGTLEKSMAGDAQQLHNRIEFKNRATQLFSIPLKERLKSDCRRIEELVSAELSLDLLNFSFNELRESLIRRVKFRTSILKILDNSRNFSLRRNSH